MKHGQYTLRFPAVLWVLALVACCVHDSFSQYNSEQEASIPLEHFYIKRQKASPFRFLLSRLNFGLSTGYAPTSFRHDLDGFGIIQEAGRPPEIFGSDLSSRYSSWVSNVTPSASSSAGIFMVRSDTADIGFKSSTFSIPLKATVHVEFDRYRVGGGYSFDYTRVGEFRPVSYASNVNPFSLDRRGFFMRHYFGMAGVTVYRYYEYALVADVNIGGYKLGRDFNAGLIQRSIYVNLGVTAEREFSEYFRVFFRPSYEIKNYRIAIPEGGQQIRHRLNGMNFNIGVTYRLPELRRCFLRSCHAQINHVHGNREYRSRMHPIYKKQDPHYGENYPELIKYKGRNKKKLNPY